MFKPSINHASSVKFMKLFSKCVWLHMVLLTVALTDYYMSHLINDNIVITIATKSQQWQTERWEQTVKNWS